MKSIGTMPIIQKKSGISSLKIVEFSERHQHIQNTQLITNSQTDIRLAFLMISENAGDRLNMDDGIADAYKDATDIDASTSTNEVYDVGSDFYSSRI